MGPLLSRSVTSWQGESATESTSNKLPICGAQHLRAVTAENVILSKNKSLL